MTEQVETQNNELSIPERGTPYKGGSLAYKCHRLIKSALAAKLDGLVLPNTTQYYLVLPDTTSH